MAGPLTQIAQTINRSSLHNHMVSWLTNIPGLPPIVQTVHIICIAIIMGSIVMLDLRVLGVAAPGQSVVEMSRRLRAWMWSALALLLISGLVFVIARPRRYFSNPVFGIKMALIVPAILISALIIRLCARSEQIRIGTKLLAFSSLLLWLCVALAGRWIAYVDYLLPVE